MATTFWTRSTDIAVFLLGAGALWRASNAGADWAARVTVAVADGGCDAGASSGSLVVPGWEGGKGVGFLITPRGDYGLGAGLAGPGAGRGAVPLYWGGPYLPQQLIALIRDD